MYLEDNQESKLLNTLLMKKLRAIHSGMIIECSLKTVVTDFLVQLLKKTSTLGYLIANKSFISKRSRQWKDNATTPVLNIYFFTVF